MRYKRKVRCNVHSDVVTWAYGGVALQFHVFVDGRGSEWTAARTGRKWGSVGPRARAHTEWRKVPPLLGMNQYGTVRKLQGYCRRHPVWLPTFIDIFEQFWRCRQTDGRTDGQTDRQTDRRTDRQNDRTTERQNDLLTCVTFHWSFLLFLACLTCFLSVWLVAFTATLHNKISGIWHG
jgi:hypothetical protein